MSNLQAMLGHMCEFHAWGPAEDDGTLPGPVVLHRGPGYSGREAVRYVRGFPALLACVKEVRPDVLVQLTSPVVRAPVVSLAGRLTRTPVVLRYPGDTFNLYAQQTGLRRIFSYLFSTLLSVQLFRRADQVLVLGRVFRDELLARGIDPQRLHLINQPVLFPDREPGADHRTYRERLGLPVDRRLVLFVGRATYLKGADRLRRIIPSVVSHRPDVHFVLIGPGFDGGFMPEAEACVTEIESVAHTEVHQYYHACDAFVFPSRREGVPNVILEAVRAGLPVLASPVGEIVNIVPRTLEHESDFVQALQSADWSDYVSDGLDGDYDWDEQKQRYEAVFQRYARSGRP